MSERDPQTVDVGGDIHACMFIEQTRQVPRAGIGNPGKARQRPIFGRVGDDGVLNAMHRRMQVIAAGEPRRDLRIRALAAQVQHQMAGNGERAGVTGERTHDVQHEVQSRGDPGAGITFTVNHEQAVVQDFGPRCKRGQLAAFRVVRRARIAVQESRPSGQQGAGADGHDNVPRANAGLEPIDDGPFILAHRRLAHIIGEGDFVRGSRHDDHRPRRQRARQGRNVRERNADGGRGARARSDIVNLELNRALLDIRAAQDFHWTCDIQQQHALGQYDPDLEGARFTLHHAACRPASWRFLSNAASASPAVKTRAKRPSRTSSVRALMSAAVQWRPWPSVMAKVSVASLTKSTS